MNASLSHCFKVLRSGLVCLALAALPGLASADGILCSKAQPNTIQFSVTDVTFHGSDADDCWGVGTTGQESSNPWVTGGWTPLVSDPNLSDSDPGTTGAAGGFNFSLTATVGPPGVWSLGWTDTGTHLPFTMDLVVVLSAGNAGFASYLFEDELFQTNGTGAGTFLVTFAGTAPLTSFAIYQSDLRQITNTNVPEPTVLALVGIGLLGAAGFRSRRQRPSA